MSSNNVNSSSDDGGDNDAERRSTIGQFDTVQTSAIGDTTNSNDLQNPISHPRRHRRRRKHRPWDEPDSEGSGAYIDPTTGEVFHPETSPWNAHGVFYVRVHRATQLPCPVGSSVCAVVSLPPYKGKIRTSRKNAYLGTTITKTTTVVREGHNGDDDSGNCNYDDFDDGVCVHWGSHNEFTDGNERNMNNREHDEEEESVRYFNNDDNNTDPNYLDGLCEMVNGYSSEESLVPTIKIQLMFSPLGMGVFDFEMFAVELSCHVLLRNAGIWRSRWVTMNDLSPSSSSSTTKEGRMLPRVPVPMLHVDAVFVPTLQLDNASITHSILSSTAASVTASAKDSGNHSWKHFSRFNDSPPQTPTTNIAITTSTSSSNERPKSRDSNDSSKIASTEIYQPVSSSLGSEGMQQTTASTRTDSSSSVEQSIPNTVMTTKARNQNDIEDQRITTVSGMDVRVTPSLTKSTSAPDVEMSAPPNSQQQTDDNILLGNSANGAAQQRGNGNTALLSSIDEALKCNDAFVRPPATTTSATSMSKVASTTATCQRSSIFSNYGDDMESVDMEYCVEPTKQEGVANIVDKPTMLNDLATEASNQEGETVGWTPTKSNSTKSTTTTTNDAIQRKDRCDDLVVRPAIAVKSGDTKVLPSQLSQAKPTNGNGVITSIVIPNKMDNDNDEHKNGDDSSMNNDDNSLMDDDMSLASRTVHTTTTATAAAIEPHLLRAENYWVPHSCGVCSRVLFGRKGGFHCEACHLDVCADCRLNVDVRVPCGSDVAKDIVSKSIGNQMNFSKLLSIVAPDEDFEQTKEDIKGSTAEKRDSLPSTIGAGAGWKRLSVQTAPEDVDIHCIGQLRLEILRACVFHEHQPPYKSDVLDGDDGSTRLQTGDYYVRVSTTGADKTKRTPTIQNTGMPQFQTAEMTIPIMNYGVQFRIDLVDANTEQVVGTAIVTTQGLLHEQRNKFISSHGVSVLQCLKGPIPWEGTFRCKTELRTGLGGGTKNNFLLSVPQFETGEGRSDRDPPPGSVKGWIEVNVGVEEFLDRLYGRNPMKCPSRFQEEFNISTFNGHIARISSLVADTKSFLADIGYMFSWKNPVVTGLSLYVFVYACIYFDAEYSGSLPVIFLTALSLYCAFRRSGGNSKEQYLSHEAETVRRAATTAVAYSLHRPRGTLRVTVTNGRNLVSQDFGIAGKVFCSVSWDGARMCKDKEAKKQLLQWDKSADEPIAVGSTPALYTADPDWSGMEDSIETKRIKQILPSDDDEVFFDENVRDPSSPISFPILQPFEINSSSARNEEGKVIGGNLKDWSSSEAAIVVEVKFKDFLNNLPGFDQVLGQVYFPFSYVASRRVVDGWFYLHNYENGLPVPYSDSTEQSKHTVAGMDSLPRIRVRVEWDPPSLTKIDDNEREKEVSLFVQEELVLSSNLAKSRKKFDIVGSSFGAVNTAFSIGNTLQTIQNTVGLTVDTVELAINAFNFTDPFKSSSILIILVCVCFILVVVPTRLLVFGVGMIPYVIGFVDQFGKALRISNNKTENKCQIDDDQPEPSPVATWAWNALQSLPTNDDIKKAYLWEIRNLGTVQKEQLASQKRVQRLKNLWKAAWYSHLKVLGGDKNGTSTAFDAFAVIHGHRFLWWMGENEFDSGELPIGRLLLSGHAGLGTPSPLELRRIDEKDLGLCLTLFGRGEDGQQRLTVILPSTEAKEEFEKVVMQSSSFKRD